jgi:hypothetical protein
MASARSRKHPELAAAAARIGAQAPLQGFVLPGPLLADGNPGLPGGMARSLPGGIAALAWGLTPGADAAALVGCELTLAGPRGAIQQSQAWLQRLSATLAALPGAQTPAPDLLQEAHHITLRCQLTREQADLLLLKLDQPVLPWH